MISTSPIVHSAKSARRRQADRIENAPRVVEMKLGQDAANAFCMRYSIRHRGERHH
jgi:hypothetical protein